MRGSRPAAGAPAKREGSTTMHRRRRLAASATALAASALLLAACGSSKPSTSSTTKTKTTTSGKPTYGGTVAWAEPAGASPNYIFPVNPVQYQSVANLTDFQPLMYQGLFTSYFGEPAIDYADSIGNKPVWSDNDTVVTITLKHEKWSDGTPITTRDITFYINLAKSLGPNWGDYTPGDFPYNVKKITVLGPYKIQFTLDKSYNPTWYVDNQLGDIVPIPQQAWDKESVNGTIGNYDETTAGAKAVWSFLNKQAGDTSTYATNPLWQVVDGPWRLSSYGGASSPTVFVPNPNYSGPKPYLSKFEEVPFTSDSAEFNVLRSGTTTIQYGYLPDSDVPARGEISAVGFKLVSVPEWGVAYMIPNLTQPQVGPMLDQLYIRQALQHLVDQSVDIKVYDHGFASPTYGPTPVKPSTNPFVTKTELKNPYPFSVSAAETLLKDHGWKVVPGGTDTCAKPGTAANECGKGITAGEKLEFTLLVSSGVGLKNENEQFKSDAAKAGVTINLEFQPFNNIIDEVNPCDPSKPTSKTCAWQLGEYGGISYGLYPSGGGLFLPGASLNAGSYSNSTVSKLIHDVHHASSLTPYFEYENYLARDLPWIWLPQPDNLYEIDSHLAGRGLANEFGNLAPQYWYYTSSTK